MSTLINTCVCGAYVCTCTCRERETFTQNFKIAPKISVVWCSHPVHVILLSVGRTYKHEGMIVL